MKLTKTRAHRCQVTSNRLLCMFVTFYLVQWYTKRLHCPCKLLSDSSKQINDQSSLCHIKVEIYEQKNASVSSLREKKNQGHFLAISLETNFSSLEGTTGSQNCEKDGNVHEKLRMPLFASLCTRMHTISMLALSLQKVYMYVCTNSLIMW